MAAIPRIAALRPAPAATVSEELPAARAALAAGARAYRAAQRACAQARTCS